MPQANFRNASERLAVIDRAAVIRGVRRTGFLLRSSEAAVTGSAGAWAPPHSSREAPSSTRPCAELAGIRAARYKAGVRARALDGIQS